MSILQFFPTQVYQRKIIRSESSLHQNLLKECYKISEIDNAGQKWSQKNYPGGFTSYGSMTELHKMSPFFNELKTKLDHEVQLFAKGLELDLQKGRLELCSLWVNIMPANVTHSMHIHPHSVISGTYYVQVPNGARGLKLEDPRMVSYMNTPPRKKNSQIQNQWFVELKPKPGQILLFESWLRHEVPPNPSKKDRISISFNYHWV